MAVSPIGAMMSAADRRADRHAHQVGAADRRRRPTRPARRRATSATSSSNALQGVQDSQDTANSLAVQAATGNLTDVHNYTIAATEASLQTELTVAVRDRAVEAFNEIMAMQI